MPERRFLQERIPKYRRQLNQFWPRQRILIVCEGEKTEPNYFKGFPIPPEFGGGGAMGLARIRSVWSERHCVCARKPIIIKSGVSSTANSFPAENFNAALQLAANNNIRVAYSNEAFELWYVLHFEYLDTGISREDYITCLDERLGHKYEKNSETIYDEIYTRQADAIRNVKRLLSQYNPVRPVTDNPSTTVYKLVEQLNRLFWK